MTKGNKTPIEIYASNRNAWFPHQLKHWVNLPAYIRKDYIQAQLDEAIELLEMTEGFNNFDERRINLALAKLRRIKNQ